MRHRFGLPLALPLPGPQLLVLRDVGNCAQRRPATSIDVIVVIIVIAIVIV